MLIANPKKGPTRLQGIWMQPDSKRYYPYSSLAANVLGFVNADNQGGVGLEAKYNDLLEGTAGMTVSSKNAAGTEMPNSYSKYFDAEDGHDLVLTLDVEVQSYLEKGIASMVKKFDAKNGATGIVMDVNTGALVAMASYPNYDSNQYGTLIDESLQKKLEDTLAKLEQQRSTYPTEEAYQAAVSEAKSAAVQTSWRNKCIDSTYEPGSTFKPITLAIALEEGLINKNSTFHCTGSVKVPRVAQGHQLLQAGRTWHPDTGAGRGKFLQPGVYQHGTQGGNRDLLQVSQILWPHGKDRCGYDR